MKDLIRWCWNCQADTPQKIILWLCKSAEVSVVLTECQKCKRHNRSIEQEECDET